MILATLLAAQAAENCLPECNCNKCVYRGPNCPVCKDSLAVLLLACNRTTEVQMALNALSAAVGSEEVDVIVSVDCPRGLNVPRPDAFRSLAVVQSYQMSTFNHPEWKDERVARHWLSAIDSAFKSLNVDRLLVVEDDHVVMPDIFLAADLFYPCPSCFAVNLGHHQSQDTHPNTAGLGVIGNIGVVYYKDRWERFISTGLDRFCSIRGDWDFALQHLQSDGVIEPHTVQVSKTRAYHLTTCFSTRTGERRKCNNTLQSREQEYNKYLKRWNTTGIATGIDFSKRYLNQPVRSVLAPREMKELCLQAVHG